MKGSTFREIFNSQKVNYYKIITINCISIILHLYILCLMNFSKNVARTMYVMHAYIYMYLHIKCMYYTFTYIQATNISLFSNGP